MISRRSFVLGLGSVVTTSFVARATSHIRSANAPLLLDPGRSEESLYIYDCFSSGDEDSLKWRVSLGPDVYPPPPPPTWREYLASKGYCLETEADRERLWRERRLTLEDLAERLDGYGWESVWEHDLSPQAKAAILLRELKLDCALTENGRKAGRMDFVDWGGHPGSCERWVDLREDLTVSLLQARLVELGHAIKIIIGHA